MVFVTDQILTTASKIKINKKAIKYIDFVAFVDYCLATFFSRTHNYK